jgi:cholesterol transport system auxiliary component
MMFLSVGASLAGCRSLFVTQERAQAVYAPDLQPAATLVPRLTSVLTIERPEAPPGLDSDRIVVTLPNRQRDVLAGARWNAPVADLVQTLLIDSLRARGGWREVVSDRMKFAGNELVHTEIRAFSADYERTGAAPLVRVWLHGELGSADGHTLLGTFEAHGEAQASADRQSAVIAAFDAALATALAQFGTKAHEAAVAAQASAATPNTIRE